jgi:hypothetical protein
VSKIRIKNKNGNIAGVGDHAEGSIVISCRDDIEEGLRELRRELDRQAEALDDRRAAENALAKVEEEIRSDRPRASKLKEWIGEIAVAASGVNTVVAAAAAVKALVTGLP